MAAISTYVYPTSLELMAVDQDLLPVLMLSDPIFKLFPVKPHDAALVSWEQRDSYTGLMQLRGYDSPFPSVPKYAINRYGLDPGVYGEADTITEREITVRKGFGQVNQPINIKDLVTEAHEKLATRQFNRMAWVVWTMLTTGSYIELGVGSALLKRDAFAPQTFAATTAWSTSATATPLADLRAVQLLHRGHSVRLGSEASLFMNRKTFNNFISNTNTADLGGRRTTGLQTIEGLTAANEILTKDDLPNIVIHDEGYISDGNDGNTKGTFYPFIPDNTAVVVGRRTNGAPLGEFQLTRNASTPDVGPSPLVKVIDTGAGDNEEPPRRIKVFRGFNGGPAIFYPNAFVLMTGL